MYCGYLDKWGGRDMVAIKTCKGIYMTKYFLNQCYILIAFYTLALSLARDKEKLLNEVTTMLSFSHPNVMSLIGMCFDGDMPMVIMPYMSNGSVLGYVKQNVRELLIHRESEVTNEKVYYRNVAN